MRMGLNDFSAKDVINKLDQKELEQTFKYFGEEKNSKLYPKKLYLSGKKNLNTQDLVNIVKRAKKKHYTKTNPATKSFPSFKDFCKQRNK